MTADDAMRAFWTRKMEEAFAFMEEMRTYPIVESGEPMASLREAADGLEVWFSDTQINHCHPRVYFVREGLIPRFRAVAKEMNERGWILKVEDGYRSPEMQRAQSHNPRHFDLVLEKSLWELGGERPDAAFLLRRMSAVIATRCRVGTHVSGSAIDVSVFDRTSGAELERGGTYIEISARTPMDSPFVTDDEKRNRQRITEIFRRHGWQEYPWEFWHYSSGDSYTESLARSGRPARYGPIIFDGISAVPLSEEESDQLLEPAEFYAAQIEASLERLKAGGPTSR